MRLSHAMQSGVAMKMEYNSKETEPKHLRVGNNAAHVSMSAIVRLLIDKGVITLEEYYEKMVEVMGEEVKMYEKELSDMIGAKITLM